MTDRKPCTNINSCTVTHTTSNNKARCAHDIRRTKMDPVGAGEGDQGLKTRANNGSLNIPNSWSETSSRSNYMYTDMYSGLVFYLQTSWPKLCVGYHYCALYHMYNCTCIECVGWIECVRVYMLEWGVLECMCECVCWSVCVGMRVWECMYESVHVGVCVWGCLCGSVCESVHVGVCVWVCVCGSACMRVRVLECVCVGVHVEYLCGRMCVGVHVLECMDWHVSLVNTASEGWRNVVALVMVYLTTTGGRYQLTWLHCYWECCVVPLQL